MRVKRSKDQHLALGPFHVFHSFDQHWNCPDPVCENKEKAVQKLKGRVAGVQLANFGQHDRKPSTTQVPINLRVNTLVFGPKFDSFKSDAVIVVLVHILLIEVQSGSIAVETTKFSLVN